MANSTSASFGKYGKSFQEGLVQLIYEDRPYADQITEVLDLNFLELEYLRIFTEKIVNYRKKYGTHPSANAIATILSTELEREDEVLQQQVKDFFTRISSTELADTSYIKEQSLEF